MGLSLFHNRKLVIATKHAKEKVIAPLVENALSVKAFVPDNFDTDLLGTFTGEVERSVSAVDTLRKKCLLAMFETDCDLGIASEGSFGIHPSLFFVNADDELIIFIDKKNDIEVIAREISTATNFNGKEIQNWDELKQFAEDALFPSHALILRNAKEEQEKIIKGIISWDNLLIEYNKLITSYSTVYVETDMRAMHNPTRMNVIKCATEKLIQKIISQCPVCSFPGFTIAESVPGLPCNFCNFPTRSIIKHIYSCKKCNHFVEHKFPYGKQFENQMYCDICNP